MRVGLFPGQGIPAKRVLDGLSGDDALLDAAKAIVGYDVRRRVESRAQGADSVLPTALAQPAIFVASVGAWRKAAAEGRRFHYLAGHSLGEYAALVAAGSFSAEDALRAVAVRAEAMQSAARSSPGGMLAVIGTSREEAEDVARRAGVVVANDNAPGQVVLSGPEEGLAEASSLVRSIKGRAKLLEVSGPFHSDAMASAAPALAEILDDIEVSEPGVPVVSNVTARPYSSGGDVRRLLVEQLTHGVRFRESLEWLSEQGVRDFEDLGPGQTVAGLADKTFKALEEPEVVANA